MIANLQILRAFAALNVVVFHIISAAETHNYKTEFLSVLEGWGANGVDIFFVISGFVMLYTQMKTKRTVLGFLKLRVIRIAPIYWILTSVVILLYVLDPSAFREMKITSDWALSSYLFLSGALQFEYPIMNVGWTLEWEMLFYLVFALSLWFSTWRSSLAAVFIVLTAVALVLSNYILLEFLGGLVVALVYGKGFVRGRTGVISLGIGIFLLCLSILPSVRELIDSRVLLWGFPSLLIVMGALAVKQQKNKLGELLGDASYSIYLIQVLTIPVFYKVATKLQLVVNTDLLALICLISTAIGGVLMYLVLEKPLTSFLRTRIS